MFLKETTCELKSDNGSSIIRVNTEAYTKLINPLNV